MRRIVAFSGSRAEFGLQERILRAISSADELELMLVLGGTHERTELDIIEAQIPVRDWIKLQRHDDARSTVDSIAGTALRMSDLLHDVQPDIVLVYADRSETFGAAIASTQLSIPTFHIEGGDVTEGGTFDDTVRDAISRLAHFHFATSDRAAARLYAMGEELRRIEVIGHIASNFVADGDYASFEEIATWADFELDKPILLYTQHPISSSLQVTEREVSESFGALEQLTLLDFQIIVTAPNDDYGYHLIEDAIKRLTASHPKSVVYHRSLGRYRYQGLMALSLERQLPVIVMGNSSSGLKEAGYFGCPTVNIGQRQDGRERHPHVIDVSANSTTIVQAVGAALESSPLARTRALESLLDPSPRVSDVVVQRLIQADLNQSFVHKPAPHSRSTP